jgi:hypothetical protein
VAAAIAAWSRPKRLAPPRRFAREIALTYDLTVSSPLAIRDRRGVDQCAMRPRNSPSPHRPPRARPLSHYYLPRSRQLDLLDAVPLLRLLLDAGEVRLHRRREPAARGGATG